MEISLAAAIIVGLLLFAFLILTFLGFQRVPQGFNFTVEHFGKYTRTLEPGPRFILPFAQAVSYRIDMREQVMDMPLQELITYDNATVQVSAVIFFQVTNATKAAYEVIDYKEAVLSLATTHIRSAVGSMALDDLVSKREEITSAIFSAINEATRQWGVKVLRVKVRDIEPPASLVEAMTRQLSAEREKRAVIFEAEGQREAAIMRAEGERHAAVLRALGQKKATILMAEADSEASLQEASSREVMAKAEANATAWLSEALKNGDVQAVNYFVAEKYVEAIKQIAMSENQKIIMLPIEATSLTGLLQGIKTLTQEAFNDKDHDQS